jgi:hypothetical protein
MFKPGWEKVIKERGIAEQVYEIASKMLALSCDGFGSVSVSLTF